MRRSKTDTATPDPGATAPEAEARTSPIEIGTAVVAYAGSDREAAGRVVDDFGDFTPVATEYNGERIAAPARRWAVLTDGGELVFADSADLTAGPEAE